MNPDDPTADAVLADFAALEAGGARVLARRGYEDAARRIAAGEVEGAGEMIGGGRQAHPVVELGDGERMVVRSYRRGGMVRHFNRDRYFGGNRAFDELRATERARAGGVRAPIVVAAVEWPGRMGYRAALATLLIPGVRDGAAWLASATGDERLRMLEETGRQIGLMHAAGVSHPDLNLRNLLVGDGSGDADGRPVVHLIDFDRARVWAGHIPVQRRLRDVWRLGRSARKLRMPLNVPDRAALWDGYLAAVGEPGRG